VYYHLTSPLRRRVILELQDSFSRHPVYDKIVPYIQNRYSRNERPQMGIVVKGASGNKVQLAGDNFIGNVISHVMLAYVGQPAYPIEWVREDLDYVRQRGMTTLPGVYYVEILQAPKGANSDGYFAVDPLLTVTDEAVFHFQSGLEHVAQLQQIPVRGTVRMYANHRQFLVEGQDYIIDYPTGAINILQAFPVDTTLTADYRYASSSIGPVPFRWNTSNSTVLPGIVLAFGKRARRGDKVSVVVYKDRVDTAEAYGGKFEASFDIDVITRDSTQTEEIADLLMMYLWAEKKNRLELEGIEILEISEGGESEETADETADNYFFISSMSLQLRADWEVHIPLPLTISHVTDSAHVHSNRLLFETAPILVGRNPDFERI
jgi:hypothetical protein